MLRYLISLILLSFLIISSVPGCGGSIEESVTPDKDPYYLVIADKHLQSQHKEAILAALDDWATKTNYTLRYKLEFVDMSIEPKDLVLGHTIKIYVTDPGVGLAGWTCWKADNASAYILVMPSTDKETFRLIMMHELGHAFNLHFKTDIHYNGPYQSVMYPGLGQVANQVSCPDITSFCDEYGCQVDCTNVAR